MFVYIQNTNRPTDPQTNIEFFRYKFLFLLLLVFYPQNFMQTLRMRQFINFAFFAIWGGLPP